jgi:hypothetical protein
VSVVMAAAVLVVGCATPAATKPAPVAQAAAASDSKRAGSYGDYRVVKRGGVEIFCKRELVTGSRTNMTETCLTEQQMEAQRNGNDEFLRRVQDMSNTAPGTNPSGEYNNVMSPMGRTN